MPQTQEPRTADPGRRIALIALENVDAALAVLSAAIAKATGGAS